MEHTWARGSSMYEYRTTTFFSEFLRVTANVIWLLGLAASISCWFAAPLFERWFGLRFSEEWQVHGLTSAVILSFTLIGTLIFAIMSSWSAQIEWENQ